MSELRLVQQLLSLRGVTGWTIGDMLADWSAQGSADAMRVETAIANAMVAASPGPMIYDESALLPKLPDIEPELVLEEPTIVESRLESIGFAVEYKDCKGVWWHIVGVYKTREQADAYLARHLAAAEQYGDKINKNVRIVEVFRKVVS